MGKTIILIPAYQPGAEMPDLLKALTRYLRDSRSGIVGIVVVDDGSGEPYQPLFAAAQALGCQVVHHEKNCGKGAAIRTGIRAVVDSFGEDVHVVTADADGQHRPADILRVATVLGEEAASADGNRPADILRVASVLGKEAASADENRPADPEADERTQDTVPQEKPVLVLGVRNFSGETVPFRSRFGNRFTAAVFKLSTGISCGDTQTGLRGIHAALLPLALATEGDRYEYEMNFLNEAVRRADLVQVPIETVYEKGNRVSHFRPLRDSLRIYGKPLRFLISSLAGAFVDWFLFLVLLKMFGIPAFSSAFSSGRRGTAGAGRFAWGNTVGNEALLGRAAGAGHLAWENTAGNEALFGRAFASGTGAAAASSMPVLAASVLSRLGSGTVNFLLNRYWCFGSRGHAGAQALRYLALFIANMLCNACAVAGLVSAGVPAALGKAVADVALFLINYQIQKRWVFRKEPQQAER